MTSTNERVIEWRNAYERALDEAKRQALDTFDQMVVNSLRHGHFSIPPWVVVVSSPKGGVDVLSWRPSYIDPDTQDSVVSRLLGEAARKEGVRTSLDRIDDPRLD